MESSFDPMGRGSERSRTCWLLVAYAPLSQRPTPCFEPPMRTRALRLATDGESSFSRRPSPAQRSRDERPREVSPRQPSAPTRCWLPGWRSLLRRERQGSRYLDSLDDGDAETRSPLQVVIPVALTRKPTEQPEEHGAASIITRLAGSVGPQAGPRRRSSSGSSRYEGSRSIQCGPPVLTQGQAVPSPTPHQRSSTTAPTT
jgi:hypothetical protein